MYLTKEYVKNRMINLKESINEEQPVDSNQEKNQEDILNTQQGIMKYVIKFLLKYKHIIKKIPFVGKYLVYKKSKLYEEANGEISIYGILKLEPYDFLKELYKIALNREIDIDGLSNYMEAYNNYATNKSVAYEIFISAEFGARATVANMKIYQKAYRAYQIKKTLYNIKPLKLIFMILCGLFVIRRKNMLIRNWNRALLDIRGK